jgi:hypothetical protein
VVEGIAQPGGSAGNELLHTVPGQQLAPDVPPQTPSSGVSKHDGSLAAHLPAVQSSPAQQSVLAVQALPSAAQAGMALQAKVVSLVDTHSVPAQHAVFESVQSWPALKQEATHCPVAQKGVLPEQAGSSTHAPAESHTCGISPVARQRRREPGMHSPMQAPALHT